MNTMRNLVWASSILVLVSVAARAQQATEKPTVWMMPPGAPDDGRCFRELFEHADQWSETRKHITGIGYADHVLNKQFTDDELRAWLPQIPKWGLAFCLEVGAVKPWGQTGQKTFDIQRKAWDRFQKLGGKIDVLAFDEPLICVRNDLKQPDSYAVEETARFISLVREHYPSFRLGDVEPYPSLSLQDHLEWIDAVQARLKELNVRGLDFYRIDVDWVHFVMSHPGGWREVKQLENACRARKVPFSLIYWAADYGHLKKRGLEDDATWYISTMRQGQEYAIVDGKPDEYVIESWVGAPSHSVPETDQWTFTRSVLDFSRRFVEQKAK